MKHLSILFLLMSFTQILLGQKSNLNEFSAVDKLVMQIPDSSTKTTKGIADYIMLNFKSENEKIRAIYTWITSNIGYDVENMFSADINEQNSDKISKVLNTKKGTCDGYSLLFNDICTETGIKSYIINGYTKQNGTVVNMSHSWCAALIDNSWYMFDPTWGSGTVNNGKFEKKMNNAFFKVKPTAMIKSHIPFDYLWQLVEHPITTKEFQEGNIQQIQGKPYFNYIDSVAVYDSQSKNDRLCSSIYRIEKNGVNNMMTAEYLKYLKKELQNNIQVSSTNQYNAAIAQYNEGVVHLNNFVNYRNNKFSPSKSDSEIQQMIDVTLEKLNDAKTKFMDIKEADATMRPYITQSIKLIDQATDAAVENATWLKSYLSKSKLARKTMFYKVSWFGVPLN